MNLDPNFYTHLNAKADPENFVSEERAQDQQYTDEMEFKDILDEHEEEEDNLEDFIENNLGNIFIDDSNSEMLYKMNEHLNHIIMPLAEFVDNEAMMQHMISEHDSLPRIVKSFEGLPEAIENESKFVQTIDYQLLKIKDQY